MKSPFDFSLSDISIYLHTYNIFELQASVISLCEDVVATVAVSIQEGKHNS
jgi:hypothetical protein